MYIIIMSRQLNSKTMFVEKYLFYLHNSLIKNYENIIFPKAVKTT